MSQDFLEYIHIFDDVTSLNKIKVIFSRKRLNIPCLTALQIDIQYSRTATVHDEIAATRNTFVEAVSSSTEQTMDTLKRVYFFMFLRDAAAALSASIARPKTGTGH